MNRYYCPSPVRPSNLLRVLRVGFPVAWPNLCVSRTRPDATQLPPCCLPRFEFYLVNHHTGTLSRVGTPVPLRCVQALVANFGSTASADPAARARVLEHTDKNGRTPLLVAASKNHYQILQQVGVR